VPERKQTNKPRKAQTVTTTSSGDGRGCVERDLWNLYDGFNNCRLFGVLIEIGLHDLGKGCRHGDRRGRNHCLLVSVLKPSNFPFTASLLMSILLFWTSKCFAIQSRFFSIQPRFFSRMIFVVVSFDFRRVISSLNY